MIDLRVIEIRDVLPVTSVEPIVGFSPRTVRVRGSDLSNVHELYINDSPSPSIVIVSATEILAQVPTVMEGAPIKTVEAISQRLTRTDRSTITFAIGNTPGYVSGRERLVQSFLKILLQTPGTDAFAPNIGGGVLRAVGGGGNIQGAGGMVAAVQVGVDRTRQQLMALQSRQPHLHADERLLYARLLQAEFNAQAGALFTKIDLASQALASSVVALEV
jgi:hypothetical protein